jgi:hypothetical protein
MWVHVGSTEKAVGHAKARRFHVYHAGNKICVQRRALSLEVKKCVHTPETGMVVCCVYLKHRVNRCSLGVNMTHDP